MSVPLSVLLHLAATADNDELRSTALSYFVEHFSQYAQTYQASTAPAFLPSQSDDKLYRPLDIYREEECAILDVPVLRHQWLPYAEMLGVASCPPADALLIFLQKTPPSTTEKASEVFAFLASRSAVFSRPHWKKLRSIKFVPVIKPTTSGQSQVVHTNPEGVYFRDPDGYA
jgi:hypothetical protein